MIKNSKLGGPTKDSLASNLLSVRDDDLRKIHDPTVIFNECLNLTFAGQGTNTANLCIAFYNLGLYPHWTRRIRAEVSGILHRATDVAPSHPTLWNLPSLQPFLRESWRLSPPLPGTRERVIAAGARTSITGLRAALPVGTRVSSNPYVVMRDTSVFGPDAAMFRPERWLTDDNAQFKAMDDI